MPAVLTEIRRLLEDFVALFYPHLCIACGQHAPANDGCFCYPCRRRLQPTDMHLQPENEFTRRLWGKLPFKTGAAMFYFEKKGPIQHAMHQLKYKNNPAAGEALGREFGRLLRQSPHFQSVDLIVPIPLHPQKERLRGYNQSAKFAEGIAQTFYKPVVYEALARGVAAESQTKKNRSERLENVRGAFFLKNPQRLRGKNVLLVDDVLTTGATLETCGQLILDVPETNLYLATIAIAMNH